LPRDSPLKAALAADPDWPKAPPDEDADVPWTEFSPVDEKLAYLIDLMQSLLASVIAIGGGKPPRFKPWRRPGDAARKAAGKARLAERWRKHKELAARILRKG
jgi:hypothetical protein